MIKPSEFLFQLRILSTRFREGRFPFSVKNRLRRLESATFLLTCGQEEEDQLRELEDLDIVCTENTLSRAVQGIRSVKVIRFILRVWIAAHSLRKGLSKVTSVYQLSYVAVA